MKKKIYIIIILILTVVIIPFISIKAEESLKYLKVNENLKIKYYHLDSNKEGPTIYIIGGIHGDEPAGSQAAYRLTEYKPNKGKLYIFPAVNEEGLADNNRYISNGVDINRCFPGEESGNKGEQIAFHLFEFLRDKADMVIDLHESEHFAREDSECLGQSIVAGKLDQSILYSMNVIADINKGIESQKNKFILNSYPVKNTLVWAVDEYLKIPSFIVETCKEMNIEERVDFQVQIARRLINETGVRLYE